MLLSHPQVAEYLRSSVVPVWESVGRVPQVTVDFGDGRVVKRTLGGNTVMSLCLPDGRVIDALPGVYTPRDFLAEMQKSQQLLDTVGGVAGAARRPDAVLAWHRAQADAAVQSERTRITLSKAIVESPLLRALGAPARLSAPTSAPSVLRPGAPVVVTNQSALSTRPAAPLDYPAAFAAVSARIEDVSKRPASASAVQNLIVVNAPVAPPAQAALPSAPKLSPERAGQIAVEQDSINNVRLVHPAVHLFFATQSALPGTRRARDVIYQQILHVPLDDPYLGLADVLVPGTPPGTGG